MLQRYKIISKSDIILSLFFHIAFFCSICDAIIGLGLVFYFWPLRRSGSCRGSRVSHDYVFVFLFANHQTYMKRTIEGDGRKYTSCPQSLRSFFFSIGAKVGKISRPCKPVGNPRGILTVSPANIPCAFWPLYCLYKQIVAPLTPKT